MTDFEIPSLSIPKVALVAVATAVSGGSRLHRQPDQFDGIVVPVDRGSTSANNRKR